MAAKKQRDKGGGGEGDTLLDQSSSDLSLPMRDYLSMAHSAMHTSADSSIGEYSTPVIQSPSKSLTSDHRKHLGSIQDLNHNIPLCWFSCIVLFPLRDLQALLV